MEGVSRTNPLSVDRSLFPAPSGAGGKENRLNSESWKAIKGYEGLYEVSDLGRVRSLPRFTTKGRVLKQHISSKNGYCNVCLSKDNTQKTRRVHVLVMEAFRPVDKKYGYDKDFTVNHIDGDKTNNTLSNLEWCSQSENQNHAYELGLEKRGGVPVICLDTGIVYNSFTDAARSCGGHNGEMVARVCRGKRSHYRNLHFAILDDFFYGKIPEFTGKTKRKASVSLWR